MPAREIPLVTNEIYHVFNRGVDHTPIFKQKYDYQRLILTFRYYQNKKSPVALSKFLTWNSERQEETLMGLKRQKDYYIQIIAYCLMPNHYHVILKQVKNNGISHFIRKTANSYSKYFNLKHRRSGNLFGNRFKAVRVETDEQLLHLSRYIHLNPFSSFVVKEVDDVFYYPYSSLLEYMGRIKNIICEKDFIPSNLKEQQKYAKFIRAQANYQRDLDIIRHQLFDE